MTTIKDVARVSGVSITTVSFVLNNSRAVNADTKERVLSAARSLNYHRSGVAAGLLRGRMDAIGIVFPDGQFPELTSPYYTLVLAGIVEAAVAKRLKVTLFSGQVWSDASSSLSIYCDGTCDGLLVFSPRTTSDIVPGLLGAGVPFVLLNSSHADLRVSFVDVDNVGAAGQMANYLLDRGHRRIAVLSTEAKVGHYPAQRIEGIRSAFTARGLVFDPSLVQYEQASEDFAAKTLAAWMSLPPAWKPTAIFCMNDDLAGHAARAARAMGLTVPGDVSIVGFNDTQEATQCDPPLTTIRQPLRQIGQRAAELLIAQIENPNSPATQTLLATELIARHSVATLSPI